MPPLLAAAWGALAPAALANSLQLPVCPQGRRELELPHWRQVARELEDRVAPLDWPDLCQVEHPEREVVAGFHEVCDAYHNNGVLESLVADWIPQSRHLAVSRSLLHRWILGGPSPKASLPSRSDSAPWPFEAREVLHWTPAAFQLRTHPVFKADHHRCHGQPPGYKPALHADDAGALAALWPLLGQRCNREDPCTCSQIRCAQLPPEAPCSQRSQRVVALRLAGVGVAKKAVAGAVEAIAALGELRALVEHSGQLARLPSGLRHLEVLEAKSIKIAPTDAPLRWLSLHDEEEAPSGPSFVRREPLGEPSQRAAAALEPACAYRGLRILKVRAGLNALPACLGELTELRALEVSGNRFGRGLEHPEAAIPAELGKLRNLVEFSAWGQGLVSVKDSRRCPEDDSCELDYESSIEFAQLQEGLGDTEENTGPKPPPIGERYKCAGLSWDARLEDMHPIFNWTSLQKFWLDGSRATASDAFFAKAAEAWPNLRTLDLYDNHIQVDASALAAFAQHPHLHQLMLGRNDVRGKLPPELFHIGKPWRLLQLSLNSKLEGCAPDDLKHVVRLVGTKVRFRAGCRPPDDIPPAESPGEL